MEQKTMIRDQLAAFLAEQGMSINQFAARSSINSGTLSRIITGQQAIAMSHLELITEGMGKPADFFYSLYVDECLYYSVPTWRRLRPFIMSCAEHNRLDCIESIVQTLLDNLTYAPMLFDAAEELFQQGKWQAAALLYENVSASEKYQYSERLAICQYRLFKIALGEDQNKNLRAAILFECYVYRLDEADQLEGLKDLMHVYWSLHQWTKVDEIARELLRLASIQYDLQMGSNTKNRDQVRQKPIYVYILYAHLFRSSVCAEIGNYKAALDIIPLYMNGVWIQDQSEEFQRTILQFQEWGTANTFLYRLLDGQFEVLDDYMEYISNQPSEIFMALFRVVQTANKFNWNVDHMLDRYSEYIPYRINHSEFGEYNHQIMTDFYCRFLVELAAYYLKTQHKEGFNVLLECLRLSAVINNETIVIKCVNLFEDYRNAASEKLTHRYRQLIREVQDLNEKKTNSTVSLA